MNTIKRTVLPLTGSLVLAVVGVGLWWNPFGTEIEIKAGILSELILVLILLAGVAPLAYFLIKRMKPYQMAHKQTSHQTDEQEDINPQRIFNQIGDTIYVVDKNFNIIKVNQTWLETFNLSEDDVLGKKCYKALYKRDKLCQDCPAMNAFKSGKLTRMEKSTISVDGKIEYFDIQGIPVLNEEGNVIQVINYAKDITEYKKTEEELRKTNNQLKAIIETIPDAVYFKDAKNNNLILNNVYEKLAELKKMNAGETNGKLAEHWQKGDRQVIEKGEPVRTEERVVDKEGKELFLDTIRTPLYNDHQEVIGMIGISRDITERKKVTTRKLEKAKSVASREKAKLSTLLSSIDERILLADSQNRVVEVNSQFASSLGRKRQSILGKTLFSLYSTNGTADRLRETLREFHKQPDCSVAEVKHSSSDGEVVLRMQPIYNDSRYEGVLLLMSFLAEAEHDSEAVNQVEDGLLVNVNHEIRAPIKMETERFGIEITDFDIQSNIKEMTESLARRTYREESELALDIKLKSPEPGNKHDSDIDEPGMLHQVLLNIVSSAIKFTEEGKATIRMNLLPKSQ